MLILSVTGAYLVFAEDIEALAGTPRGEVVMPVNAASTAPFQETLDKLRGRHPSAQIAGVRPVEPGSTVYSVTLLEKPDTLHRYVYDPVAGEVRTEVEGMTTAVNHFILHLHADLFLGMLGVVYLGVIAVLFLASTITGLIIYAPFMKKAAFSALRFDRGWRRAAADGHKLVGAGALVFNLVIALTGIALTLGLLGARMWAAGEVRARTAAAGVVDAAAPASGTLPIEVVLQRAAMVHPEAPVSSVVFPGSFQGPGHYFCFHELPGRLQKFVPVYSLIPMNRPELAESVEVPLWIDAIMLAVPLHFGNYGGILLKLGYCLFAIGTALLTLTGAFISLSRWRRRWRSRTNTNPATSLPRGAVPHPLPVSRRVHPLVIAILLSVLASLGIFGSMWSGESGFVGGVLFGAPIAVFGWSLVRASTLR